MEDQSSEAIHRDDEVAPEPTTEVVDTRRSRIEMALNAVNRRLAQVHAALTELQAASERRATTVLMLERINADWDELDAKLRDLAQATVDHDRWIRKPVERAYARLHKLIERGLVCGEPPAHEASDLFEAQVRRLARRLTDRGRNQTRSAPRAPEDLTGRTMGGFTLRGRLAEGGFGAVYRCEQPLLGREAVVKVLRPEMRRSGVVARRFLREARLAARLDHPYAAHIYAFGVDEQDWVLWIAMERVQGVTLADWLKRQGPMPLGSFVPLFERIAAVVQTAHEHGIVHRDLKPSNVMIIERAGELLPKLLDFGVAKLLDSASLPEDLPDIHYPPLWATEDPAGSLDAARPSGRSTVSDDPAPHPDDGRLTQHHQTIGSPPYMPPEQWGNSVTVGPASDLYALAVVAFEALTGRRPFHAETMADYAELHCHAQVPPLGGSFPPALDRMFQRALAKRPEDRWGTALELAAALRAASGVGTTRSDLPRLDSDVREAWLAEAPQPLAESIAELGGALNAYQARDIAKGLILTLVRYLLAMALAMTAQHRAGPADLALRELLRALDQRLLSIDSRIRLLRLLVHRLAGSADAHPVPELLALLTPPPDGPDVVDRVLVLYTATAHAITEEMVRLQLMRLLPELSQLLRQAAFVLDYLLVVPHNHEPERWTGRRHQPRALAYITGGELVDGHPMLLDREDRVCIDLWPLVQAVPPTQGAEPELFLFDGQGPHGALLIVAPSGLKCQDVAAGDWVSTHVVAAFKPSRRMRDQFRIAVPRWWNRDQLDALPWRGKLLAVAVVAIALGGAALVRYL